jgi:hypothetical protein
MPDHVYAAAPIAISTVIPSEVERCQAENLQVALRERSAALGMIMLSLRRHDTYPATAAIESHTSVGESKNRVITTKADVFAGEILRSALAHDDIAGDDDLAAKFFHA